MVKIGGEKCKVYFWAQRLSYSRATCVSVYPRAAQECFLDGQQRALLFFDGVPVIHIIDNLKAAIKSGLGRKSCGVRPEKLVLRIACVRYLGRADRVCGRAKRALPEAPPPGGTGAYGGRAPRGGTSRLTSTSTAISVLQRGPGNGFEDQPRDI
jgi:hypothetical protein